MAETANRDNAARYFGLSRQTEITAGGLLEADAEGQFFIVDGQRGCLLKTVWTHCIPELERTKLKMLLDACANPLDPRFFSWPLDIVLDDIGTPAGFIISDMENGKRLLLYIRDALVIHEEGIPLHERIAIARNLCTVVARLHQNDLFLLSYDCNDILVDEQSCRVFLRCRYPIPQLVHIADNQALLSNSPFLPPELETGYQTHCTVESDNFALAVLVHTILSGQSDWTCYTPVRGSFSSRSARARNTASTPSCVRKTLRQFFNQGLYNPEARPSEYDLLEALNRASDGIRAWSSRRRNSPIANASENASVNPSYTNSSLLRRGEEEGRKILKPRNRDTFWASAIAFYGLLILVIGIFAFLPGSGTNFGELFVYWPISESGVVTFVEKTLPKPTALGFLFSAVGGLLALVLCGHKLSSLRPWYIFDISDFLVEMFAITAAAAVCLVISILVGLP
ncbi:MAG: hypothetical protein IKD70_07005 [Eggerthellaceae bacterium]|nr:hypothetical protein [Eggerthellaceae bacterium]